MKRELHTLHQKSRSSQCIGVTVDLPPRQKSIRLCRRVKWCARCSGTDGAFSSSTCWTTLDCQYVSCRSSVGRRLFIHPIAIFSNIPRNSRPVSVSVLIMIYRRICMSHSGSNPRLQISTTQGYNSCSHRITNVSIPEVDILKNSLTFVIPVAGNLFITFILFLLLTPWKLTFCTRYLIIENVFNLLPPCKVIVKVIGNICNANIYIIYNLYSNCHLPGKCILEPFRLLTGHDCVTI